VRSQACLGRRADTYSDGRDDGGEGQRRLGRDDGVRDRVVESGPLLKLDGLGSSILELEGGDLSLGGSVGV